MNGNQIVYRTIVMKGTSEGLDKVAADLNKVAAAHQGVTVASEQTEKTTLSLEQAMKRQALRLDEVARAQNNIARERQIADKGLKEGLIDQQRHTELINLATQRYGTASKATAEFGKQTGLARHELINLGRQAQDVGVSLASGQSPFSVLVQQGSQIADVFATSGGTLRGFFTQAIGWGKTFITSTAGIVTAVLAIGGAAIYAASQFVRASTTIEEALAEQKRLMDENKTAVGGLIDAQIKLQSTALTRFQMLDNERDLWGKLKTAMEEAAKVAERRVTRPAQVPGEMGEAPTGLTPLKDPGYAQIADAIQTLRAAMNDGRAGLVEFNNELGKIGEATPEVTRLVAELINAGQQSLVLEAAALRASAALKSVAQQTLGALQIKEAGEATERMAQETLKLAALYPGMSIEVAKQLHTMDSQLQLAQTRTAEERAVVQELITQNKLMDEGKTLEEAMAVAAAERLVAEENITRAINGQERPADSVSSAASDLSNEMASAASSAGSFARNMGLAANQTKSISGAIITWHPWISNLIQLSDPPQHEGTAKGTSFRLDPLGLTAQRKSMQELYGDRTLVEKEVGPSGTLSHVGENKYLEFKPTTHEEIMARAKERQENQLNKNTEAIEANTAATETMTDVLSPYYSTDPRRTHLGFRSFSRGGIMTAHGELPLRHYQGGGVAHTPQVAVYGEGSTPEAYVPVPSGRIPVEIKQPANSNQRPIHVTINVMGNTDANTVSALKSTAYQQAQAMRRAMG